mmetsp:Transcript_80063/g.226599  ORF Transcript_80063/g.226599 Transcript_80063/m.226599 type:complete len:231 (-) Transcript_80063:127-819(-)
MNLCLPQKEEQLVCVVATFHLHEVWLINVHVPLRVARKDRERLPLAYCEREEPQVLRNAGPLRRHLRIRRYLLPDGVCREPEELGGTLISPEAHETISRRAQQQIGSILNCQHGATVTIQTVHTRDRGAWVGQVPHSNGPVSCTGEHDAFAQRLHEDHATNSPLVALQYPCPAIAGPLVRDAPVGLPAQDLPVSQPHKEAASLRNEECYARRHDTVAHRAPGGLLGGEQR